MAVDRNTPNIPADETSATSEAWRCGGQRWDPSAGTYVACRHVLLRFDLGQVKVDTLRRYVQVKCRRCNTINGYA